MREAVVNSQASIASALTAKRSERQEPLRAFRLSETPRRTSQSFPCGKRKKDVSKPKLGYCEDASFPECESDFHKQLDVLMSLGWD